MLSADSHSPQRSIPPGSASVEQLRQWDREFVWHAFTQMAEYEPLIIESARGCTLVDVDGRELLDGVSSLWCNLHGHCHPRLNAALQAQAERVAHVTSLGQSNPTTIYLAQRLVALAPPGLGHVFFSGDGSSAVEVAIKMAFQYWQQRPDAQPHKVRYVALEGAYHGDTLGSVSVGGVSRFHSMFRPLLFDAIRLPLPDTYRRPEGVSPEAACDFYLAQLQRTLEERQREIAAVVIEPILQAAAGMVTHPPGYLAGVRRLTRQYGVLLIADEVAVGFGRTGTLWACQQEGVAPDLLCLGKGLTGGYLAMSATLATAEIWNAFLGSYAESRTFFHGHTYGGNPLAAAVALASLEVFDEEQTLAQLPAKAARLAARLARIRELPCVGDVRQRGLIAGIELVQDRERRQGFPWEEKRGLEVCRYALEQGVWLRPLGNVIVIMPPLSIRESELDQIVAAVEYGLDRLLASL